MARGLVAFVIDGIEGHSDLHRGSSSRTGDDFKASTDFFRALFHSEKPKVPMLARRSVAGLKAATVVAHAQVQRTGLIVELDAYLTRVRVLDRIRDRFLSDAQEVILHPARQTSRLAAHHDVSLRRSIRTL